MLHVDKKKMLRTLSYMHIIFTECTQHTVCETKHYILMEAVYLKVL